jgi:uncharacterized protein (DUF697 family)
LPEKEEKKVSQNLVMKALDYGYEKALNGLSNLETAESLAAEYLKSDESLKKSSSKMIKWQISKAGTSGFLTGLGGIITLPLTVPANLASVLYIQIRMIATIAVMGGHDLRDDKVKSMIYLCIAGNAAKDVLKDMGIIVGEKLALNFIKNISSKTIKEINKRVGFELLTKFGSKGAINLSKAVPIVGGIIGGTIDSASTLTIGKVAQPEEEK